MNTNKGECHCTLYVHLLTVLLKLYSSSNIYFPLNYLNYFLGGLLRDNVDYE